MIMIWGMTMKKRIIASALIACSLLSVTACDSHTKATVIQTMATFETTGQNSLPEESESTTADTAMPETITLRGSGDDTYPFSYDSDIITYSGQGGKFFLVGSSPTECYLHIMVQSGSETYEDVLKAESERIDEEFTLDSGRRAFCYKTSDASTCHVIIEADGIISGNGLIKITIGSADSWMYSHQDIANMVDKGF